MGRKHYGKRRNCSLQAISPFPTGKVFSKHLYCRHVKTWVVWKRVNPLPHNVAFLRTKDT